LLPLRKEIMHKFITSLVISLLLASAVSLVHHFTGQARVSTAENMQLVLLVLLIVEVADYRKD
jgi:hypothetical protein